MKLLKENNEKMRFKKNYRVNEKLIISETETSDNFDSISITTLQQKYNIDYGTAELLLGCLSSINAVEFVPTYYAIPNKEFDNICNALLD